MKPDDEEDEPPKRTLSDLFQFEMIQFYGLCILWYSASALTNNIGKDILNQYRFPITLTYFQFAFIALFCLLSSQLGMGRIKRPSVALLSQTVPLSIFQIFGHIFSSVAILYIPVSFVHTIKALSPLFTVFVYRFFFQIMYSSRIYASLLPLTIGVMLSVANGLAFDLVGCACALASTVVFVVQNIFSKKLFINAASRLNTNTIKLDKLTLLFYSASGAFFLMFPLWAYSEGFQILLGNNMPSYHLCLLFLLNGSTQFVQSVVAFWILSIVSPITYSIASLVKRIFVITASIIYFGDTVSIVQRFGICLTFVGLYLYDTARYDVAASEAQLLYSPKRKESALLPLSKFHKKSSDHSVDLTIS